MIVDLLSALARAGIGDRIVVLRNAEELPAGFSGTDLDVSVLPGFRPPDVVEWIGAIAKDSGWRVVLTNARPHIAGLSIHHREADVTLHFDVFDGVSVYGMVLMTPDELDVESVDQGGFRVLTARGETAVTVLHHLSWNGCLSKEKYRDAARAVLASDREWLVERMTGVWGPVAAGEILEAIESGSLGGGCRGRRRRLLRARLRTVGYGAGGFRLGRYWLSQAESLLHPAGLVGVPGAPLPADPEIRLTAELACEVAPHSIIAPSVRSPVASISNLNGPRYEAAVRNTWRRWALLRWTAPSLFVWYLAKRGRVLVLDEPPWLVKQVARRGWLSDWVAR
ncbi:MAG: hypothetical protein OEO77_06735 [Acidimicrobiia bacterium]|nr:hypothetical protein [Acidimicrobiia bacterium]